VRTGLLKAGRRARQIGATSLQIFSDNPTAWRRRTQPPRDASRFVDYVQRASIAPIAIHASYLINLAGSSQPFASQSLAGLIHEVERAPAYGASLVNVHIGSHRGGGSDAGLERIAANVVRVLEATPPGVSLVLENSAGGGDTLGATIEQLAVILESVGALSGTSAGRVSFCLDSAHLWGSGYDIATMDGVDHVVGRFAELIGLERLPLIHLNDSRSLLGSRTDRHEHLGAGQIGPAGLGALLRDPRLRTGTTFIMETPGVDEGYDAVNMRRALQLFEGAVELPQLPARAFTLSRRSTRAGIG
jgi:deoxyribonuclease-4